LVYLVGKGTIKFMIRIAITGRLVLSRALSDLEGLGTSFDIGTNFDLCAAQVQLNVNDGPAANNVAIGLMRAGTSETFAVLSVDIPSAERLLQAITATAVQGQPTPDGTIS
jgi:hypothetical protein